LPGLTRGATAVDGTESVLTLEYNPRIFEGLLLYYFLCMEAIIMRNRRIMTILWIVSTSFSIAAILASNPALAGTSP
jgi:hypothetical protein